MARCCACRETSTCAFSGTGRTSSKRHPASWRDVLVSSQSFGFTGRESGLFGLFFELVVGAGGALFDVSQRPTMTGTLAEQAVETLCALAAKVDGDIANWHYDDVDRALTEGQVAMAAAWPGATTAIRSSRLSGRLVPAPYPTGEQRWVSYSGCHGWAIPQTCGDVAAAVDLVLTVSSAEAAAREAAAGGVPALRSVLDELVPVDEVDRQRLDIVRRTIADAMITYPPLRSFPSIEDAGWSAINLALRGSLSPADAVGQLQATAENVIDLG
jgi:multiple sugar transport system substrate-binding protein